MSDEPSDVQKLIAETLRVHEVCFGGCDCGWRYPNDGTADHRGHVAAEVDKALGGLTRQSGCDMSTKWLDGTRWVSGWTVTE